MQIEHENMQLNLNLNLNPTPNPSLSPFLQEYTTQIMKNTMSKYT